jgi:SM-20-related protein
MDALSDNQYVVIDNFLDDSLYELLRSYYISILPDFSQAGIGALNQNTIDKNIRGDNTYWLDRKIDLELSSFWKLVDETIAMYNRYCYLSLSGYEFHFAYYPPGGHYDKHIDQFDGRNNRMISLVIYLNEGWQKGDGGELKVFKQNGTSTLIEPLGSRCVMFKSAELPHQVMEAKKGRYSLTGWLLYRPSALGQFFD